MKSGSVRSRLYSRTKLSAPAPSRGAFSNSCQATFQIGTLPADDISANRTLLGLPEPLVFCFAPVPVNCCQVCDTQAPGPPASLVNVKPP